MGVDAKHAEYNRMAAVWERCRDAVAGEDVVKGKGERYLPRPGGQKDAEYEAYKTRSHWFGATKRTKAGIGGLIRRRDPQIDVPEAMADMLVDITASGLSVEDVISRTIDEVIETGRFGILVDFPRIDASAATTIAQQELTGARPFVALYRTEEITNWRTGRVGGRTKLTMVVLRETVEAEDPADEFVRKPVEQYRVLDLGGPAGAYRQRIYRKKGPTIQGGETWILQEEIAILMRGKPMPDIPFVFFGPDPDDGTVQDPPIKDVADVNFSHYRTQADIEHAAHWTALPTPVFMGLSSEQVKEGVNVGSITAIGLPVDGDAKFLEFSGQGLEPLEKRLQAKAEEMAILGARILSPEKRQVEAAETASIHRAGENSVLASIANTIGRAMGRVVEIMRDWAGLTGDVSIKLNTDYLPAEMSPQMLQALTAALQAGTISGQDYFWYLQQGEVIRPDRTFEEAQADIESSPPLAAQIAKAMASAIPPAAEQPGA